MKKRTVITTETQEIWVVHQSGAGVDDQRRNPRDEAGSPDSSIAPLQRSPAPDHILDERDPARSDGKGSS
jgi:hypothetical protein